MVRELTDKQKETLEVIESYITSNGIPPTFAELQVLLNVSSNQAVLNHLSALEEKGYIERRKTARGIKLLKTSSENETEGADFLDLLTNLAIQRRQKAKAKPKISSANPYSTDEDQGKILVGYYNNEQY